MRKIYVLALMILFLQYKAQHTLTAAFNPIVGDIESAIGLDSAGLFLGSSGTSQIWNYSGISTGTNSATSFTYVPMSSVTHNNLYPSGTIARRFGAGVLDYIYNNTSTKIEYLGTAQPTASNCQVPIDPVIQFTLPFTYGSSNSDTYSISSWMGTQSGTVITNGDGTGTLQLPSGNYSNVLKITLYDYQSLYTSIENRYYSPISKFPLLSITSTTIGSNVYVGGHINTLVSTSLKESIKTEAFNVFPNPVTNGTLFLKTETKEKLNGLEIINILGQKVLKYSAEQLNNAEIKKIDVSTLQKGVYYVNIQNAESVTTKKIIIE